MKTSIDQLHPLVLNVGLAIHNADWNWKNVNSPFMRLYYVTDGQAQIELPTGTYLLKPNHMYCIPAFTSHSYICNSYFCHYYLHIYEEHRQESCFFDEWDMPVEIPGTELDLYLFKRLCTINPHMSLPKSDPTSYDNNPTLLQNVMKNKQRALCDKIESRGIVYQLLSHFVKRAQEKIKSKDERVRTAITYIHNHLYEMIDLDALADDSCLSKDHFSRLFKHETGVSPLQYINQKKIEKAQLMLVSSNMPVKNIASSLAFDNYSYFNRLFKKMTGVTPQEYRSSYH